MLFCLWLNSVLPVNTVVPEASISAPTELACLLISNVPLYEMLCIVSQRRRARDIDQRAYRFCLLSDLWLPVALPWYCQVFGKLSWVPMGLGSDFIIHAASHPVTTCSARVGQARILH